MDIVLIVKLILLGIQLVILGISIGVYITIRNYYAK